MGFRSALILAIFTGFLAACATVSTQQTASFHDDLSPFRPELFDNGAMAVSVDTLSREWRKTKYDLTDTIFSVLDSVARFRRSSIAYVNGFTIQVYVGDSRNEAREARLDVLRHFPDLQPSMIFDQPNYKVRIGSFYTQLEAYGLYTRIKHVFKKAILVPSRIYLK